MTDRVKIIEGLEMSYKYSNVDEHNTLVSQQLVLDAIALMKEQEAEIRQLRLALDIEKGTCKGIKSGGGQFADMPTLQSAT